MKTRLTCTLALASAFLFSSCSTRLLEMSVAGSKDVKLSEATGYVASHNQPTKGTHRSHIFLILPFGRPNIEHALDRALENAGPNAVALYNMTLDETDWYIPFLYGQRIYIVKGDPVFRTGGQQPAPAAAPEQAAE